MGNRRGTSAQNLGQLSLPLRDCPVVDRPIAPSDVKTVRGEDAPLALESSPPHFSDLDAMSEVDLDDLELDETPFVLSRAERGISNRQELSLKAAELAEKLKIRFGATAVRLTITDNSSSVLSFRQKSPSGEVALRLHHMFLEAPEAILDDVVTFARGGKHKREANKRLSEFIDQNDDLLRQDEGAFRPQKTSPIGKFRNLKTIYDRLNAQFFQGRIEAQIGWGRLPIRPNRRSIRFGAYSPRGRTIRIHPVLDSPNVPDFFVDYVVFHEMLHQAIPQEVGLSGRRAIHSKQFRQAEERYPDYAIAQRWSRENIVQLLRGMPLRKSSPPKK